MLLTVGFSAGALALLLTAAYLPLSRRFRILDAPNHRSAHTHETPSSGGLAIVAAVILVLLMLAWQTDLLPARETLCMTGLVGVLCALGAWDDRHAVPVMPRLGAFLLISALALGCYWPLTDLALWWFPVVALALTWQLNLYNFMDGIDGIAALQCVLVAGGLALLSVAVGGPLAFSLVAVVIAGAYAGFLVFNWPPARLFMGDAGSLSAGLLLAWLGLWLWRDGVLPTAVWLLLMSPFLLDTTATLLARMRRRERLTEAHKSHLYQRLARHVGSHRRVDYALLLLQLLWLLPLSFAVALELLPAWTSVALGLFPQFLLMAKFRRLQ